MKIGLFSKAFMKDIWDCIVQCLVSQIDTSNSLDIAGIWDSLITT